MGESVKPPVPRRRVRVSDEVPRRRLGAQEPVAILNEEPRLGADAAQPAAQPCDGGEAGIARGLDLMDGLPGRPS